MKKCHAPEKFWEYACYSSWKNLTTRVEIIFEGINRIKTVFIKKRERNHEVICKT